MYIRYMVVGLGVGIFSREIVLKGQRTPQGQYMYISEQLMFVKTTHYGN